MAASPHILMCPPDYYGIEYEINPWMSRYRQVEHALAVRQWSQLRSVLEGHGAEITCLTPQPGLPDLVFTANLALICGDVAVPGRFRHPERQPEEAVASQWLAAHGFQLRPLTCGVHFEGAGDALFCGETLFAGYRIRSSIRGHQEIAELLHCQVIPLELVDPYFYFLPSRHLLLSAGARDGDLLSAGL